MKRILITLLMLVTAFSYAQSTGVVGGKILDAELFNEPLAMATVSLQKTDWSTQTNFNGNFEILDVAPGSYILEIRFLGYESTTLPIEVSADKKAEVYQSIKAKALPLQLISESTEKEIVGELTSDPSNFKLHK
ncbi:carboxypeptidase-like regulatory domain-containing protein [Maribacter aestuarii]|uniref:carboxypeptidase-like regulatory domain-containing protein n=1 Tax=Maribacter aestuarii TaxID=1130723 RepID=UPI00248C5CEF|nr:carboxypeptidase-like regulatory domain-containing protein [Maribacter aestuarii]